MLQTRASPPRTTHAIILFDGVCNLCNRSVRFIIARDPARHFRFASLQSTQAKQLLQRHHRDSAELTTMVLVEGNFAYTRSDAVVRITRQLRFPWPLTGYLLICIPRRLRDAAYDAIARWRYRVFGRSDFCPLPDSRLAERFL